MRALHPLQRPIRTRAAGVLPIGVQILKLPLPAEGSLPKRLVAPSLGYSSSPYLIQATPSPNYV
ncbi:hypothetical protein IB75_01750 [Nitrosococcus oceani C-27]|uniref:Uncharacterized protein n=1 Tax=Nitrosococcus oceani C-27 TaxID=314279 RepID=A0A0E2ZQM0_9GAMM|nr:hypothetical protein IB75_01750 [Nitrosococcus oceani C-27]